MSRRSRGTRAQSETLGFVLIFAVLIIGVTVIIMSGGGLDETQNQLSADRAENTLSKFDSKAALVALGRSDTQEVSLPISSSEQLVLQEDRGWMNVTALNQSSGSRVDVMNTTLGAIVYRGGETTLAYQGGGVWRDGTNESGLMVSPPEFHYRGSTLTLPAITVSGDSVLGGRAVISQNGTERMFPTGAATNPLDEHRVTVTVRSEFYRGWGRYFETRTDGTVVYDHANNTAKLVLISPIGTVRVDSAVSGYAPTGTLRFQANPSHPCPDESKPPYFDRYDSDESGSYCDQYTGSVVRQGGDFVFGGDVETQANAGQVQGNIISGGAVELHQNQLMHGNVSYVDNCKKCEDAQEEAESTDPGAVPTGGYRTEKISGTETVSDITYLIETLLDEFRGNLNTTTVSGGDELTAGSYYLDEIDLGSGETLVLNTTGGDITLGVNDTVDLDGARIEVQGPHDANLYVGGTDGSADLRMSSSEVFVPENNATRLAVLGGEDFTTTMQDSDLTGVIYAPAGTSGDGSATLTKGSAVYGGIVTGDMTIGNPGGGTVHHDAALFDEQIVPPDLGILRVTYLHVTRNEIAVNG
jgi:hypothetical protein